MTKFEEFKTALIEAGFEDTPYTTYCIFSGDETPENESLDWKQADDVFNKLVKVFGLKVVDSDGGGEGGSEYCYSVIRLGEKFYRAEYSYFSYHGYDYDEIEDTIKEVTPVQKVITVYE